MKNERLRAFIWKTFYALNEQKYEIDGHTIRYLFRNNRSNRLCVVFSAFPQKGKMPGYNYVKTLWNGGGYDYLFICDDMVNIPTGGSYYLGNDGYYWGIDAVESFLAYFTQKRKYERKIAVGSSKGGTAALIFGLEMQFDAIVIGACQYKIGSYLNCPYHYKTLQALTGAEKVSNEEIERLDDITKRVLLKNRETSTEIWFHYSTKEHTYNEQIKELLRDLHDIGYVVHEDVANYQEHSDVAKYFPAYMLRTLEELQKINC